MTEVAKVIVYLRELNFLSVLIRMVIAMLFGGLIGLERMGKQKAAGFRTYILVCLGATLSMLLGQYEELMIKTIFANDLQSLDIKVDVSRFGAQVVNGIGFLGTGTIIVTQQKVKGLTTAAGLWASACTGLAIGAGFYEGVCLSFIMMVLCIMVFPSLENRAMSTSRNINIYIEFEWLGNLNNIIEHIKKYGIQVLDIDYKKDHKAKYRSYAILMLRLPHRQDHVKILTEIGKSEHILAIEEI